eukprot:TRINITY_DN29270_c0_g1_i1.p2 TRINITY_DN29270_c0_g1~~TRINITY_DN29270_c0_g1_i1.p2  ORF type:complete len:190 (-),score=22.17 TRINITY_DN29270_c0_g1_i1:42-611(-)
MISVIMGFLGMLLIMKPPFFLYITGLENSFNEIQTNFSTRIIGISFALISSILIALIFIVLRKIKVSPTLTVQYQNILICGLTPIVYFTNIKQEQEVIEQTNFIEWKFLSLFELFILLILAFTTFVTQLAQARGLQLEKAGKSSILNYGQILLGYCYDILFFSGLQKVCLLYTSPSPRDRQKSRMPSSA